MQDFTHIETFWRGGERFKARVVVEGGRLEAVIVGEDGAVASGASRYRHTLADDETRQDVLTRVQIAVSMFCHGAVDNPEIAALRATLSVNMARAERLERTRGRMEVPVPDRLPAHPWFGRAVALERAEWLSAQLEALGEAPLTTAGEGGADVLRCTLLPSFRPPQVVRVCGPPRLAVRAAFGRGHPTRPGLEREVRGDVSLRQWEALKAQVAPAARELEAVADRAGLDGETWLLEAYVGDLSVVGTRWSPELGPFSSLCGSLMALV